MVTLLAAHSKPLESQLIQLHLMHLAGSSIYPAQQLQFPLRIRSTRTCSQYQSPKGPIPQHPAWPISHESHLSVLPARDLRIQVLERGGRDIECNAETRATYTHITYIVPELALSNSRRLACRPWWCPRSQRVEHSHGHRSSRLPSLYLRFRPR